MTDPRIDWKKYPRLARMYANRPDENWLCRDLRALLDATAKLGQSVPAMLLHLEHQGDRVVVS